MRSSTSSFRIHPMLVHCLTGRRNKSGAAGIISPEKDSFYRAA